MSTQVILAVTSGPSAGKQYSFAERTTALIGREDECHIRFPKDKDHQTISRHHCLLDINPPECCIRDLGSRCGTYLNGELIGMRERTQNAKEGAELRFAEHTLKHGDEIKMGRVVLRVTIASPASAAESPAVESDRQGENSRPAGGEKASEPCAETLPPPESWGTMFTSPSAEAPSGRPKEQEKDASRSKRSAQTGEAELQQFRGYHIEKELGRGGMGAVYLAVSEQNGERVALKVMLPQMPATQRHRDQFMREAANTKALRHRHVVGLRDLGYSEDKFFFTLEYCEGGSVQDLLKKSGRFPVETAVPLVMQALDGLEYAHRVELPAVQLADGSSAFARGLVHRDIKPGNILLAKEGNAYFAKVGDYGLAKAFDLAGLSGLSVTGQVGGTPGFMPRQQLLDYRNARPEVDVWGMAASLYYMLTLCYPRDFKKGTDVWKVVVQTDAIPIRQRRPDIPATLATVIDHALVEKPAIGFKTAAEFCEALSDTRRGR
jgi:hypothetical protein